MVLGLDALETGIKMLPVSVMMLIAAAAGSRLSGRFPVRSIVRAGLVITGLTSVFLSNVESDPAINDEVASQVSVAVGTGIDFVSTDQIETAAQDAGLSDAETTALVGDYEDAQLQSLKLGLLLAAFLALCSLVFTRDLPRTVPPHEVEATAAIGAT